MTHAHALAAATAPAAPGPALVLVPECELTRLIKVDLAARAYMTASSQRERADALISLMQAADDLEYLIASVRAERPDAWTVVSRTSDKRRTVTYVMWPAAYQCDCPAGRHGRTCAHTRAVSEYNRRAAVERTGAAG